MKKRIFILFLGISISLFYCGFCIGTIEGKGQLEKGFFSQSVNWQKVREGNRYLAFMEEEKEKFLEEHLYGKWRFLKIVRQMNVPEYKLSSSGGKELKEMVVLEYQKEWVKHPLKKGQSSFSDPMDMWIFALEGGLSWEKLPTYTIKKVNENWIHVIYSSQSLQGGSRYLSFRENCFGSDIYIDLNDTESIYVKIFDFWKLTRIVEESEN